MRNSHEIILAMSKYAEDHHGGYPTGSSSTAVFQELLDDHYVSDPTLFWFDGVNDKQPPRSTVLKSENVCFDVTIAIKADSPDMIPVIFSTGFKVDYASGTARPIPHSPLTCLPVVSFKSTRSMVILRQGWQDQDQPTYLNDGTISNLMPAARGIDSKKYQQLTPIGLLPQSR